jgi:hypothetical protein
MLGGDGARNRILREARVETVIKEDGRYLIYYSWPDAPGAEDPAEEGAQRDAEHPTDV